MVNGMPKKPEMWRISPAKLALPCPPSPLSPLLQSQIMFYINVNCNTFFEDRVFIVFNNLQNCSALNFVFLQKPVDVDNILSFFQIKNIFPHSASYF